MTLQEIINKLNATDDYVGEGFEISADDGYDNLGRKNQYLFCKKNKMTLNRLVYSDGSPSEYSTADDWEKGSCTEEEELND